MPSIHPFSSACTRQLTQSLDCGRKPEHPERTHADITKLAHRLHSNPGRSHCEVTVLTATPLHCPGFQKKSFAAKNLWTSPHGVFLPLRCSARPSLHLHRVTAQFCLHALKSILCWFVIRWLTWPLKNITFLRPKNSALWNVVQSVVQHLAQSELASAFLIF